jgi:serine/threonine protein kinase
MDAVYINARNHRPHRTNSHKKNKKIKASRAATKQANRTDNSAGRMAITVSGQWTRLRTLGRGASGAVVYLAADAASGELFAVKSAPATDAAPLSRKQGILSKLCSPHVVRCVGGGHRESSYNLFLELAPGGSLAHEIARNGGRLAEHDIRAYTADILRGLAYIHEKSLVHGDVKARNLVIGADGRAKLADFGCARMAGSDWPIGGTPAFMAPEVAQGEAQGLAADVWALGSTVVEMATGRAPWSDVDSVLAAVHRIGYTDAVPEAPAWLSHEAKDFLALCFTRDARDRSTAAELLEHPFLALSEAAEAKGRRVSPKSTLDAAFWESESDEEVEEEEEILGNTSERIKSLASCSLPDWDSDDGWIDVLGEQRDEVCDSPATKEEPADVSSRAPRKSIGSAAVPAEDVAVAAGSLSSNEQLDAKGGDILADDRSADRRNKDCSSWNIVVVLSFEMLPCNRIFGIEMFRFPRILLSRCDILSFDRFCSSLDARPDKYVVTARRKRTVGVRLVRIYEPVLPVDVYVRFYFCRQY